MSSSVAKIDDYKLSGVQLTNTELGHGSYATVLALDYLGLKCAGKKIHEHLLSDEERKNVVHRFEKECRLLSQIQHPNIVQFLGVFYQPGAVTPVLVMEFLQHNLTACIKKYGILPDDITYSVLNDIALGINYLHRQIPPILHRDLSSNNILLTPGMNAKISDLGVAKILNLSQIKATCMTQTPGTLAFMPPEVLIANPKYDASIDVFSYGVLIIHILTGKWPDPQMPQVKYERGKLIPVSEAERREKFLQEIGDDHPLMELILKCVNNDSRRRASSQEILKTLEALVSRFPPNFENRLEIYQHMESVKEHKGEVEGQHKYHKLSTEAQEIQSEIAKCDEDFHKIGLAHIAEVAELQQRLSEVEEHKKDLLSTHSKLVEQLRLQEGLLLHTIQSLQDVHKNIQHDREQEMNLPKIKQSIDKDEAEGHENKRLSGMEMQHTSMTDLQMHKSSLVWSGAAKNQGDSQDLLTTQSQGSNREVKKRNKPRAEEKRTLKHTIIKRRSGDPIAAAVKPTSLDLSDPNTLEKSPEDTSPSNLKQSTSWMSRQFNKLLSPKSPSSQVKKKINIPYIVLFSTFVVLYL